MALCTGPVPPCHTPRRPLAPGRGGLSTPLFPVSALQRSGDSSGVAAGVIEVGPGVEHVGCLGVRVGLWCVRTRAGEGPARGARAARGAGLPVRPAREKRAAVDGLTVEVRARKLAGVRRGQALTRRQAATPMGVSAPRVFASPRLRDRARRGGPGRGGDAPGLWGSAGGRPRVGAGFGDAECAVARVGCRS